MNIESDKKDMVDLFDELTRQDATHEEKVAAYHGILEICRDYVVDTLKKSINSLLEKNSEDIDYYKKWQSFSRQHNIKDVKPL